MTKWVRTILFLRPSLFLLLDELEAPRPALFQWMLHAFEKMEIGAGRLVSRRRGAVLEVELKCEAGLNLSQSDRFDTPYNHGIPDAYHRDMPNHWHVTASTAEKRARIKIAAVMSVYSEKSPARVELSAEKGWLGVTAAGPGGRSRGWIRFAETTGMPPGFEEQGGERIPSLIGVGYDGEEVVI